MTQLSYASYVPNPFVPQRRQTRVVRVGDVAIGGDQPIRVQSMTNTDTRDTQATADQIERLADAGCEIARVTAPSITDAENLAEIKAELSRRRVKIPIVADIHFTPNAAMIAALHVEKVRINPGNYADKKKFELREYSEIEYAAEIDRVAERFRPLVRRCREEGVAMRIGTNHGSLSDRIMNRFGDTPAGMVESALEFLDVCEDERYYEIVFSMKASNTQVAIAAYRLLARRLDERARDAASYPFHVGVTEAGDGEDGRIKSAIGIGSLLEDGIGDTIRVSLTEDPVREVPVAMALAMRSGALGCQTAPANATFELPGAPFVSDPFSHLRRPTCAIASQDLGGHHPVRVELNLGEVPERPSELVAELRGSLERLRESAGELVCEGLAASVSFSAQLERWSALRAALRSAPAASRALPPLSLVAPPECAMAALAEGVDPHRLIVSVAADQSASELAALASAVKRVGCGLELCLRTEVQALGGLLERILSVFSPSGGSDLVLSVDSPDGTHAVRLLVAHLAERGGEQIPVVLRHRRLPAASDEEALLAAAIDLGAPLCDGIGDAVSLEGFPDAARAVDIAYRILQGARLRTTRSEFISCPSCGRTLFDLEETTATIKRRTEHLSGVKIAIMGCIVNGPGEMADADFGYVGSGPGQVTLYSGQQVVERAVPEREAPDRLVEVIRKAGRWCDPDG